MDDSRGTRLLASCWVLVAASATLLSLRIYCKLWRGRGLWWDDHLLIIAWTSLVIAVSINSYIVTLGFGRHTWTISDENLRTIHLNTILVATFGIISTTTGKTSFCLTLYRIATKKWMKHFLIFVIVSVNVSMNLVWIFGFAKCTPLKKVFDSTVPGTCWNKIRLTRYQLFAAYYSAILDFVLALLPWQILTGMAMLRRERLGVAIAMSLGAVAGITGIVKAVLVVHMTSPDITYDRVDLTIWTLAEPAVTIMAISIPVLRMLYRELTSSQRSYFRNKPPKTPSGLGSDNTDPLERHTRYPYCSKYGRNSVVIMSDSRYQESQEALRDADGSGLRRPPLSMSGVIKTEEVRVHSERLSTFNPGNSMELNPLGAVHKR